jgi:opacity protein-like surface antigen
VVFGGGVEATLPGRLFVNVRASRFRESGERVFLFNGEQFDLGVPATITVTPIELTGGYRFAFGQRFVPYAGAGIGWHRYQETSQFSEDSENVDGRFTGFQLLGGAPSSAWRAGLPPRGRCSGPRCPTRSAPTRTAYPRSSGRTISAASRSALRS